MNQMVVFYGLALALADRRLAGMSASPARDHRAETLDTRRRQFATVPDLIRHTLHATHADVERAAALLYLRPSLHLLATRMTSIAKEGALKIREVVLNHAEGFEASEFKHGPNTILGFNTVFGPDEVERLLASLVDEPGWDVASAMRRLPTADYPLIYITGPDERDVALTVSQMNTHKIRGASTVVIAEEHPALRGAASKAPAGQPGYRSVYIALPPTGDTLLAVFSATVALQRLALTMSVMKKAYLDGLGILNHGVDPDAPKNVSKSITVD